MNESNDQTLSEEFPEIGNPAPQTPKKPKGISKYVWIGACGCLLLGACVIVLAFGAYFGLPLLWGDPIASVVPDHSLMYMSVDLTRTQSEQFSDIVTIVQEIAEADKDETLAESLDKLMKDELDMSFTEDVLPWVGQYGALAITEGDILSGDIEMIFIVQTRNPGKADEFISKFVKAMEDKQNTSFVQSEKDGVTFYISDSEFDFSDTVIARSRNFVYLSNTEKAISDSINLEKKNSLGRLKSYKEALAVLPKNRLATLYMNSDAFSESLMSASNEVNGLSSPYIKNFFTEGLAGAAMSLSVVDEGLRMDVATIYDETKLSDYQKEALATKYLAPTTDALMPADTYLFMGMNRSKSPASYTEIDNPLYSPDMTESFDLFKKEYDIDVMELIDLLSGEFALALGPADDGFFVEAGEVNMGITLLAGTQDEAAFNDWFDNLLNKTISQNSYTQYDISDTRVGEYGLKELAMQQNSKLVPALIYGADNGFFVLGSSPSMLESGFTGSRTLANNELYRQTWKAFPAGSVPYMYLNLEEFMKFLADNENTFGFNGVREAQTKLRSIPVVAISMTNTNGNIRGATMIVFIDKNK